MNGYEAFFWSTMIIGGAFFAGYHYAKIKAPPRVLYEQTHVFKDPIVVKEGDTIQMFLAVDEKYFGRNFEVSEDGSLTELNYTLKKDFLPGWSKTWYEPDITPAEMAEKKDERIFLRKWKVGDE
jgi:hypothetical protein